MKKFLFTLFISTTLFSTAYSQISFDTSALVKNNRQIYAITISQNDHIIYSQYFNGKTSQDLFNNQSLTKSVMSLLIGIAIDKGYITSVNEKIVKYFPQLKRDSDKRKQEITIRQIMNQASGLTHEDPIKLGQYLKLLNQSAYILQQPMVSEPGKEFHYNNAATHLLSAIITKATGMSTFEFAKKYLFGPMDIKNVKWGKMNDGYYDGCGLLSVQLANTDMNRIGSLLLHNGRYNGKSIVPDKWIEQLLHPTIFYNTPWGFTGSAYALCYYHFDYNGTPITYGLGWGGQFVFIIPDKKAVITVNQSINDITAIRASNLLLERIFPMMYQQLK